MTKTVCWIYRIAILRNTKGPGDPWESAEVPWEIDEAEMVASGTQD